MANNRIVKYIRDSNILLFTVNNKNEKYLKTFQCT